MKKLIQNTTTNETIVAVETYSITTTVKSNTCINTEYMDMNFDVYGYYVDFKKAFDKIDPKI